MTRAMFYITASCVILFFVGIGALFMTGNPALLTGSAFLIFISVLVAIAISSYWVFRNASLKKAMVFFGFLSGFILSITGIITMFIQSSIQKNHFELGKSIFFTGIGTMMLTALVLFFYIMIFTKEEDFRK